MARRTAGRYARGKPLDERLDAGVGADEVAGLRPAGGQRVLDDARHLRAGIARAAVRWATFRTPSSPCGSARAARRHLGGDLRERLSPLRQISVAIEPGSISATWIPWPRSSRRSESEKPCSASFDAP